MRKKLLTVLFVIGLLFFAFPIAAQAEDHGWCGQDAEWSFDAEVLTITGKGDMNDFRVSSVPWRNYCDSIVEVNIESGITSIGYGAFSGCISLKNVTLPESMIKIGAYAFSRCSGLTGLEIPDSVTDIGVGAFTECTSLESIKMPQSIASIESMTFLGCQNLKKISIPNNVRTIGSSAFSGCNALESITLPAGVTSIGASAFCECYSLSGGIVIPESVTEIKAQTFQACKKLEYVELPDKVTSIGKDAFIECHSLTKVNIPAGVTKIEYRAFFGCIILNNIELPDSVTSIGESAFANCSKITDIKIPSNVMSIGSGAFSACPITSIVIPEGITSIGEDTFFGCGKLKSVTLPASITEIGENAFLYCQSIGDVFYSGTEKQRERISIKAGNDYLTKIDWEYTHQHSEVADPAVEPTYFEEGKTEGSHCSACGETIIEQQAIPKKVLGVPVLTAAAGTDSVKLTWSRIDGAAGYEIFRSIRQAGSYSKLQTVSGGNAVSFNDTGLSAGTTYYYKVRAVATANGKTAYSSDSNIASAGLPEVIYKIKASAGKGGKADGGSEKKAGEKVTLKATPDKGYYFAGWKENNKKVSSSQTYTFQAEKDRELTASFAKLSAPALTAASAELTSVKVSWKKIAGATGYEIYRADSKNGKYVKKAVISKAGTVNYTDKGLTTGKTYYYKMRAVASGTVKTTYSSYSGIKSAKPLPAKVTGVKASAGSKSVLLSWKKVTGVTGYEIYRATGKNGKYKKVKSIGKAAAKNYADEKLKAKKAYYYKVRAYKTVSGKKVYGAFSDVRSAAAKK